LALLRGRRRLQAAALAVLALVCAAAGLTAAVGSGDGFCSGACHEMKPLTKGLAHTAHRGVPCLDCHGPTGTWHAIVQKFAALRSMVAHLSGGTSADTQADVPDQRCRRCHRGPSMPTLVTLGTVAFRHESHTGRDGIRCVDCHRTTAHGSAAGVTNTGQGALDRPATERACLTCHSGEQALPCTGCHVDAGHRPRGSCGDCHRRGDWLDGLTFRHEPRLGKAHGKLSCETCHREGMKKRSLRCSVCHAPAHGGLVACGRCHVLTNRRPARFTHPAIGPHEPAGAVSVSCGKCHPSGYATSSCTCHQRPAGHPALGAAHATLSCRACHWSAVGGASAPGCAGCHGTPHSGLSDCAACHGASSWASTLLSHRGVPHIDGKGRALPCSRCHTTGYATAGCACHSGSRHRPQVLRGAHAATACARCHVSGYGSLPGGCSSCHHSPHGGPADCVRCHDTSSWTAHFNHRRVAPHVPAGSPALACVDCHRSTYSRSSCSCHATPTPSPSSSPSPAPDSSPDPAPVSSPSPLAGQTPGERSGDDARSAAR